MRASGFFTRLYKVHFGLGTSTTQNTALTNLICSQGTLGSSLKVLPKNSEKLSTTGLTQSPNS